MVETLQELPETVTRRRVRRPPSRTLHTAQHLIPTGPLQEKPLAYTAEETPMHLQVGTAIRDPPPKSADQVYIGAMTITPHVKASHKLLPAERAYIRRELDQIFSSLPRATDGFLLKIWKTGPKAGQPKLPPPAESLVSRGLMEVRRAEPWPRLYFTSSGMSALRRMMSDTRLANPKTFAHIRAELSIDIEDGQCVARK